MQPDNQFSALQQALQSLTGQAQPQQTDPAQLFNLLIANAGSGMKLNMPVSTDIHPHILKGIHPVESQATKQAIKNGADPAVLNQAQQMLGKNAYIGLCEAFVERMTQGREGIYPSAHAAWQAQQNRAQTDLNKIKPGDSVYFKPDASNGYNGHTAIYQGGNKILGATYNGIKSTDLNEWQKQTGQKLLGFIPTESRITQARGQIYSK